LAGGVYLMRRSNVDDALQRKRPDLSKNNHKSAVSYHIIFNINDYGWQ